MAVLNGKVTSGGSPLPGVNVMAGAKTSTTSSTGAYSISKLATGLLAVKMSKSGGYVDVSVAINIRSTNNVLDVVMQTTGIKPVVTIGPISWS